MKDALKELLENEVLTEEVKTSIQEAWDSKVEEVREETEQTLREEYAGRFEHDKGLLVEAMDRMLEDAIREELEEFAQDRKALANQRVKLSKAIRESRKAYRAKMGEHFKVFEEFFLRNMSQELREFKQERKELQEKKVEVTKKLREVRQAYKAETANRINKLEGFVLKQMTKEVTEFHQDKKALIESRVEMVTKGKQKINAARKDFIKRASNLVEGTIEEALRKELTQFRDDVKVARENNFGRRVFEAFAAEYMASYLSEGSKVKELEGKVKVREAKLGEAIKRMEEQQKLLQSASTKIKVAEDKTQRTHTMSELLGPLRRDKRAIMEDLLESVKTKNLREAYHRYLPAVLNEDGVNKNLRSTLKEDKERRTVAVTGDRKNRLTEAREAEEMDTNAHNQYLADMKKLAGISS